MKKLENLLDFEDFKANWKSKESKKTKRTEIGLDIIEENKIVDEVEEITEEKIEEKKDECPLKK